MYQVKMTDVSTLLCIISSHEVSSAIDALPCRSHLAGEGGSSGLIKFIQTSTAVNTHIVTSSA